MTIEENYKILRVDLNKEKIITEVLDDSMVRKYLGGAGLAAKIIWDETKAGTDPLGEENVLIFAVGPFTGTPVPHNSRCTVGAISPETGIWGEAHFGGSWPATLRYAGYLAIVLTGKSNRPVYLWLKDGDVKIVDARHVWGIGTYELESILKRETDEKACVVSIGPAGEKMVRIANIIGDGSRGKAAGRCGLGAVMGSKNLKALVVRGTGRPRVYDGRKLRESIAKYFPKTHEYPRGERDPRQDRIKLMIDDRAPFKNFQLGEVPGFTQGFAQYIAEEKHKFGLKPDHCLHCPTCCGASRMLPDGKRMNNGELVIPMGGNCLINDSEFFDRANLICNDYGVDSISVSDLIAFAMECYDRGLISKHDTQGIELTWGNKDACLQILQKIVDGEGFGKILGQGFKGAVDKIGGSAEQYAMHVKGAGLSFHDPRRSNGFALSNATNNRGADHCDGYAVLASPRMSVTDWRHGVEGYSLTSLTEKARKAAHNPFAVEGMGEYVAYAQNVTALTDSLTLCMYGAFPTGWLRVPDNPYVGDYPSYWAEWLMGVADWQMDATELLRAGERIFNLRRLINVRRGVTRKDDTLPKRLLTQSRGTGPAANNIPPLNVMLDEYYTSRGWSPEGIPTKEKLIELGIP